MERNKLIRVLAPPPQLTQRLIVMTRALNILRAGAELDSVGPVRALDSFLPAHRGPDLPHGWGRRLATRVGLGRGGGPEERTTGHCHHGSLGESLAGRSGRQGGHRKRLQENFPGPEELAEARMPAPSITAGVRLLVVELPILLGDGFPANL